MERHKLVESFKCAVEGIFYVLKTQRNMRVHFIAAAVIIALAVGLDLSRLEFLFISFAIFFVLFAEMANTAAELTIDLISETYNPLARLVKDIGAGAVLIASLNAVVVGYLVFVKHIERHAVRGLESLRTIPLYVSFLALLIVLIGAVSMKLILHSGSPMRGGMPSAHSAVAFSAAAIVVLLMPSSFAVIVLAYFLALMVAQSRIAAGIHTFAEAFFGAVFGTLLTLFLYRLYKLAL